MVSLKSHIRKLSNHWFCVLLVIMLQGNIGFAQVNPDCFEGYFEFEGTYVDVWSEFDNLEDTFALHPWVIDTSLNNNIWQIGVPHKTFLDSAFTAPNALITDTILNYPVNNYSSFYEKFCSEFHFYPMYLNSISIAFRHKFQTDTLHDGLYIELSYDNGNTWSNIINSDSNSVFQGLYSSQDTLYNGTPGFSGNSSNYPTNQNGWKICDISLTYFEHYYNEYESVMFRFVFISDSINDHMEGWLIDDLYIGIFGWWNNVDETDLNNTFALFPNPTTEKVQLKLDEKFLSKDNKLTLSNVFGQKLLEQNMLEAEATLDVSFLERGVYFLQLESFGYKSKKKLVIN